MFKNATWKSRYLAAYDEVMKLWPVEYEEVELDTSFGTTHITVSGARDAPPLMLLPGAGASSTMWLPNIEALSEARRTYAIDTLGDYGKSVATRVPETRAESARWMAEVYAGLGVEKAPVVGLSYGAFLTLSFAIHKPELAEKIVIMSPAATLHQLSAKFPFYMLGVLLCPGRPRALCRKLLEINYVKDVDERLMEQAIVEIKSIPLGPPHLKVAPEVMTDEELRSVKVPALLLMGEKEWCVEDPPGALERFLKLVPGGEAEMLSDAAHVVSSDQPELVNSKILTFISS